MQTLLAIAILIVWHRLLNTELGALIIVTFMDFMGALAILVLAMATVGWSFIILIGKVMNGA